MTDLLTQSKRDREKAFKYLIHTTNRLRDREADGTVEIHDYHKVEGAAIDLAKRIQSHEHLRVLA